VTTSDITPTVTDPRQWIDTHGGHGFLFHQNGRWVLEHYSAPTGKGRWTGCPLGDEHTSEDQVRSLVRRHLARRPHAGPLAPQLARREPHLEGDHYVYAVPGWHA
jgi:hypothetical protein